MMTETTGFAASLDERAILAHKSAQEMENLLEDFKPFLNSRVSRCCARADSFRHEELLSVAMSAFFEAVRGYDGNRGHFFSFMDLVVRRRLIDAIREEYKNIGKTVQFESDKDERDDSVINEMSENSYRSRNQQEQLAEEIEQYVAELDVWGITLDSLSEQSPKHGRLLAEYRKLVNEIAKNDEIVQTIQVKRYFPVKLISTSFGLPPKNLERARTFILASLIIKLGDYNYLSEYIKER